MSDRAFGQIRDGSTWAGLIDLAGPWEFKRADESEWLSAEAPGSVITDLLRAGKIEDPYYRDNELKVQQIGDHDWEYRRSFEVAPAFLEHDNVVLDCRGLDTIATVTVNDATVGETKNMFVEHELDVKPLLRAGENTIRILFESAVQWCKGMDDADPRVIWHGIKSQNKGYSASLRKEACDFGWDWGLRLVRCGIWRPLRVVAYDTARLAHLDVRQDLGDPDRAVLHVTAEVERYADSDLSLDLSVTFEDKEVACTTVAVTGDKVHVDLAVENPRLWWPNGWGEQALYTVTASLKAGDAEVHSRRVRVGLRTFEMVREKDERGETFGFKLNGHLIFCKGANWIPADAIPERLTVDHYRHMLQSCVDAHFNMLRVWGGGRYEADCFYDFCDEHGILLWHDFMFAEGPYLPTPEYLDNVRAEVRSMVRRLKHHPCVALWCGNNESEAGMTRTHKWLQYETVTWEMYDEVFNKAIPETLALCDADRPYWPCSPHNPLDREAKTSDFNTASGDAHYWKVWHSLLRFSAYTEMQDFRFVSEYGHQSFPTMETIRSFTLPEDRHLNSLVLEHHQKCSGKGCQRIAYYIADMFLMPTGFENWVYLSHLVNAEGMRVGTEAFRRNFPHTTGALYWQLNDNWPTFSGSSIDYYGRWKAVHYMARRFFSPILASVLVKGAQVTIWGVNDYLEQQELTLRWSLRHLNGREIRGESNAVVLPANSSTVIAELDFEDEVGENPNYKTDRKESYQNRRNYCLVYELLQGDRVVSSNISFFVEAKFLPLEDPDLKYTVEKSEGRVMVIVTAEKLAAYVEVGLKDSYARFSDNYFHLPPDQEKRIDVVEAEVAGEEIPGRVYVKSLFDSYE